MLDTTGLDNIWGLEPPYPSDKALPIGHVNNIPIMKFFTGIYRISNSKFDELSLTECVWDLPNNALCDTH